MSNQKIKWFCAFDPLTKKNGGKFQTFYIHPCSAVDSAQWDWGITLLMIIQNAQWTMRLLYSLKCFLQLKAGSEERNKLPLLPWAFNTESDQQKETSNPYCHEPSILKVTLSDLTQLVQRCFRKGEMGKSDNDPWAVKGRLQAQRFGGWSRGMLGSVRLIEMNVGRC